MKLDDRRAAIACLALLTAAIAAGSLAVRALALATSSGWSVPAVLGALAFLGAAVAAGALVVAAVTALRRAALGLAYVTGLAASFAVSLFATPAAFLKSLAVAGVGTSLLAFVTTRALVTPLSR